MRARTTEFRVRAQAEKIDANARLKCVNWSCTFTFMNFTNLSFCPHRYGNLPTRSSGRQGHLTN